MGTRFFQKTLDNIADRSRHLLDWNGRKGSTKHTETIENLSHALLSGRGEASGVALARQVLDVYAGLAMAERIEFFRLLARDFGPDLQGLRAAWSDYDKAPTPKNLVQLLHAVEPPRQELFRRLNLAPGGTSALVALRQDLLDHGANDPELASVDNDLVHLLYSWFNRGFLTMHRITWSSPADILERIIRYEAVHIIQGWDDLRRRVQPPDRRCYAFFHPSLVDEPLIFVRRRGLYTLCSVLQPGPGCYKRSPSFSAPAFLRSSSAWPLLSASDRTDPDLKGRAIRQPRRHVPGSGPKQHAIPGCPPRPPACQRTFHCKTLSSRASSLTLCEIALVRFHACSFLSPTFSRKILNHLFLSK